MYEKSQKQLKYIYSIAHILEIEKCFYRKVNAKSVTFKENCEIVFHKKHFYVIMEVLTGKDDGT
jgi:hypothetical protein